ncbi:MAG: DUF3078 domain-containing protein [Bacteroidota bacterium]
MYSKFLLLFVALSTATLVSAQNVTPAAPAAPMPKAWKKTIGIGLTYSQTNITNPPAGYGQDQIGANAQLNASLNYDKHKIYWNSVLDWNFGLLRLGTGPISAGSNQKVPFLKSLDQLQINSIAGYRVSKDSTWSVLVGTNIITQATASYTDPEQKVYGVFLKDIRNSGTNPIQSKFFAPAKMLAYVGIGYQPSPKLFFGYSPVTYKAILVLDPAVARLVGAVDAQGLPTKTVHGNPVEIVNGAPVFKRAFNLFGSYLYAQYKDRYAKGRIGFASRLQLYSNYLDHPENIDVYWQNMLDLNIIKGLKLTYQFDVFYDQDVLVAISDKNAPGGLSGKYGQRASILRQLMLRYVLSF